MFRKGVTGIFSAWLALAFILVLLAVVGVFNITNITGGYVSPGGDLACDVISGDAAKPLSGASANYNVIFEITGGNDVINYTVIVNNYSGVRGSGIPPVLNETIDELELCRIGGGIIANGTIIPQGSVGSDLTVNYNCDWSSGKSAYNYSDSLVEETYSVSVVITNSTGGSILCSGNPSITLSSSSPPPQASELSCNVNGRAINKNKNQDSVLVNFNYTGDAKRYRLEVGNFDVSRGNSTSSSVNETIDRLELCRVGVLLNGTINDLLITGNSSSVSYNCSWVGGKSAYNKNDSLVSGNYTATVRVYNSTASNADFVTCSAKIVNLVSNCGECTGNCTANSCNSIPGCYFSGVNTNVTLNNSVSVCFSCSSSTKCSDYNKDSLTCISDPCNIGCGWSNSTNICSSLTLDATCVPDWKCGDWSVCGSGQQIRRCSDDNNCGTSEGRPAQSQSCEDEQTTLSSTTPTNNQNSPSDKNEVLIYSIIGIIAFFIVVISIILVILFNKKKSFPLQPVKQQISTQPRMTSFAPGSALEQKIKEARAVVMRARAQGYSYMQVKMMFIRKGWPADLLKRIGL